MGRSCIEYHCACGQRLYKGQERCPSCKYKIDPSTYETVPNDLIKELDEAKNFSEFVNILKKHERVKFLVVQDEQSGDREVFDLNRIREEEVEYPSRPASTTVRTLIIFIIVIIAFLALKFLH